MDKLIDRNESDPGKATIRMRSNNDNGKNEQENLPERRGDTGKPMWKNGSSRKSKSGAIYNFLYHIVTF